MTVFKIPDSKISTDDDYTKFETTSISRIVSTVLVFKSAAATTFA